MDVIVLRASNYIEEAPDFVENNLKQVGHPLLLFNLIARLLQVIRLPSVSIKCLPSPSLYYEIAVSLESFFFTEHFYATKKRQVETQNS